MTRHRIVALLLTVVLAIPVLSSNAQTPVADSIPSEEELEGLQATVWREYAPAGTFFGSEAYDATPGASPIATPTDLSAPIAITVQVRQFDTAENAAAAFERLDAESEASLATVFSDGTVEITSEDLLDIGTQASRVRIDATELPGNVWLEYVTVQRDQYVFFVSSQGSLLMGMPGSDGPDRSLPTVDIATAMTDGDASADAPVFAEDGTSTGGLWSFMLPADDPLLAGVEAIFDSVLFPVPDA